MKISFSTVCVPELDWRAALAHAAGDGYRYIELLMIPGWKHVLPSEVSPTELRAEAARHKVEIIALHGGGIDAASPAALAESIQYLDTLARFARDAGVALVNFNGGRTPPGASAAQRVELAGKIGTALAAYAPRLDELGVRLTLENHYGFQLQEPADYDAALAPLAGTKSVGITVDTGHFSAASTDMPAFIRAHASRIFHVHIKDHIGLQSVALGAGQTDNCAVIRALRAAGYDGFLSVELEVEDRDNALRYTRDALAYVQRLIAS